MLFKDLNVGDVFKLLITGDTTFIKLSTVNDNELPFKKYCNYPNNMFIIDKQHYGVLSPMAEVYRIKEFHGKEQEKTPLKELCQKYLKGDSTSFMTYGGVPYDKISKDALHYTEADVRNTMASLELRQESQRVSFPSVEKVIFNNPATIVIWKDGTKTVVKCQNDEQFDPEKGLALCFMKKALGNKSNFNNAIHMWVKDEEPEVARSASIYPAPIKKVVRAKKIVRQTAKATTSDTPAESSSSGRRLVKFSDYQITAILNAMGSVKYLAHKSRLSVATVKKALHGEPVTLLTLNKIQAAMGWEITT